MKLPVSRAWLLPAVLVLALSGLLAASTTLWLDSREDLDQGAVEVARQQAKNFFSLDHRHPDQDIDTMLELATKDFRKEYAAKRDEVVKNLVDKKIVVTARVPEDGAAVEYLRDDRARVLVAVDVTTAAASSGTENARYRTRIDLEKVDGDWLVAEINQVG